MVVLSTQYNNLVRTSVRSINKSNKKTINATEKISTGNRINRPGDDSASLSISSKLKAQLNGENKVSQNIIEAMDHMEIAFQGINQTIDNVQRIREIFIQGINGTNSTEEKDMLQREINLIVKHIDDIAKITKVNAYDSRSSADNSVALTPIVNNSTNPKRYETSMQIGSNDGNTYSINFNLDGGNPQPDGVSVRPATTHTKNGINFEDIVVDAEDNARVLNRIKIPGANVEPNSGDLAPTNTDSLADIDVFLKNLYRMSSVINQKHSYLQSQYEANQEKIIGINQSLSQFKDTDISEETTLVVKEQIRQETASSMLTQANLQGQLILNLLP